MASSVKIEARQAFAYTYPGAVYPGCEFVRAFLYILRACRVRER